MRLFVDAGVPLTAAIAGVAMGLMGGESGRSGSRPGRGRRSSDSCYV